MASKWIGILAAVCLLATGARGLAEEKQAPGATRVARWKDDAKSAFMMMFDDSIPSHVNNVVPALKARNMTGTFYVNPGKHFWQQKKADWEKAIPAAGMEYGHHTWTHGGVKTEDDVPTEFGQCAKTILEVNPPSATSPLLSYAQPGGIKKENWCLSAERKAEVLAQYTLVERPTFNGHGASIHVKSADDIFRLVEKGLENGTAEYVIFHGVGGDYLAVSNEVFTALLDRLETVRDRVWIAGHVAAHKYETERATAKVEVAKQSGKEIRLRLSTDADPKLYDSPLTLVTTLPEGWAGCEAKQGGKALAVVVAGGAARYDAMPSKDEIVLTPAK